MSLGLVPLVAADGLRESYRGTVAQSSTENALAPTDFGDTPSPYPTRLVENGARHTATGPTLGANRDEELDGTHSLGADADDTTGTPDDEDGVSFGTIQVGQLGAGLIVNVQNAPAGARLDAWIDFNADGSWGGPFEQIADTKVVVNGDNPITFDVPSWAVDGMTYARFRLSTAGGLGPAGSAGDGEVEDYQVTIGSPSPVDGVFGGQNVISDSADYALSVFAADMDGDGDMDVLSASNGDSKIAWYENDGSQNFTAYTISDTAGGARSVFAVDMDGDGDMDVLCALAYDDEIAWYENDGSQNFTEHTITSTADEVHSVFAADVDGDGDMDVLSASAADNKIAWYENDGSQNFTQHTILITAGEAWSVFAADVDGDGDMDVLSASDADSGTVAWYENDGSQNFTPHTVSSTANDAWSVSAADMDGDGDMDVLSASRYDDKIVWHENDGSQSFTTHTISTTADYPTFVFAADVDGDGDMDVLSSSLYDNKIAWYENDGSQNFAAYTISSTALWARSVFAADVDGDGDLDVLSASATDDKIAWYENLMAPRVTDVWVSDALISGADTGPGKTFTVTVDFSKSMDQAVSPTIAFDPDVSSTLTFNAASSGWSDADTYQSVYDVADADVDVGEITIDVTGAKDAAGPDQRDYTPEPEFGIDTLTPTVTGIFPLDGSVVVLTTVDVDVTFSEAVQDLDETDLELSGTAAVAGATVAPPVDLGGNQWRFPVSGLVDGTLDVRLAPDADDVEDLAGNDLATRDWSYIVANPPPVLDLDADDSSGQAGSDFAATFTEAGWPVLIADGDAQLSDPNGRTPASLTVTITNQPDGAAEVLAADTTGTSIAAAYDAGTGVLSLTGSDTVENYRQVLRTVTYQNTLPIADLTARVITFVANNSVSNSNTATTTVTIDPVVGTEDFNYTITATGTEDVPRYPDQPFNWTVTGTGTETWTTYPNVSTSWTVQGSATETWYTTEPTYFTESVEVDASQGTVVNPSDTRTIMAPVNGEVFYTVTLTISKRYPYEPHAHARVFRDGENILNVDEDDVGSYGRTWEGSFYVVADQTFGAHVDATRLDGGHGTAYAEFTYPVGQQQVPHSENRIATSSGHSGTVNQTEGDKLMGTWPLYPAPEQGGDMGPTSYTLSPLTSPIDGGTWVDGNGSVYANTSYSETPTATRTATDSGSGRVNALEGDKDMGPFSAAPQPQQGGAISGVTYSVSDNNANVSTSLSGGRVYANTTYSETEPIPWLDTESDTASIRVGQTDEYILTSILTAPNSDTGWSVDDDNDWVDAWMVGSDLHATYSGPIPPVVDLNGSDPSTGFSVTFTEAGGAVLIADTDAQVTDPDSLALVSLSVAISNLLDGASEILDADVGGTAIGKSYSSATGVLSLTGSDTPAKYEQVLRSVSYENTSLAPDTTTRIIDFVANDGTNNSNTATTTVSIVPVNDPPAAVNDTYNATQNTALVVNRAQGVLANDTDADQDTLTAVPTSGPSHGFVALNTNGSFTYTPNSGFSGTDGFTYRANDGQADSNVATVTLNVTALSALVGRYVFYNNSTFDNNDSAPNSVDDAAIAIDKQALLPGQTATFANYTGYHRGINGIMVDIQDLADPNAVRDGDFGEFTFKVGNSDDLTQWLPAPDPLDVDVRDLGSGVHRVTITWADNAIGNKNWLQVTVKAHAATGLAADDVFYFGNSSGENTGDFRVDYSDAFDNIWPSLFTPDVIGVDHPGDVNRDGRIDYSDIFDAVWPNLFGPSPLVQLTAPAAPASLLQSTDSAFNENRPWAIELMWFDELYRTSSNSEEEEDDALEATAVDGVFAVYYEE